MADSSSSSASSAHEQWHPSHNPWLIAIAVMAATFMEILDTSVANVSLPHIAGSLSATPEEATWVLTSYLVSNAIVLPITGWLGWRFGRRRFLMMCVGLFTVASVLCGMAPSLGFLIVARVLQGIGGGAMQPIAQAVLLESFPPEKHGVAMATYGMGVIVAPILGPTLGGWITDNYSWRWIFYINVPVGIFAILMAQAFVEDPPYIKNAKVGRVDFSASPSWRSGWARCRSFWTRARRRIGSRPPGSPGSRDFGVLLSWPSSSGIARRASDRESAHL